MLKLKEELESFKNAKINATIQTDSISTNSADRDAHLKGEEFFNVEANPQITFETDSLNNEIGSITIPGGFVEIIEKRRTDFVSANNTVKCTPVAYK